MQVVTAVKDKDILRELNKIQSDCDYNFMETADNFEGLIKVLKKRTEKIDLLLLEADLINIQKQEMLEQWAKYKDKFLYVIVIFGTSKNMNNDIILNFIEKIDADDFIIMPCQNSEIMARFALAQKHLSSVFAWQKDMSGLVDAETLDDIIRREWQRAYRNSTPLSLIMIEIEFSLPERKEFIKSYRQPEDYGLQRVASAISEAGFRPGDIAGLYRKNVFAILLPDTNLNGAREVGKRVSRLIKVTAQNSNYFKSLDSNMGIAGIVPSIRQEANKLIRAAEEALAKAKSSQDSNLKTISGSEIESNLRLE